MDNEIYNDGYLDITEDTENKDLCFCVDKGAGELEFIRMDNKAQLFLLNYLKNKFESSVSESKRSNQ